MHFKRSWFGARPICAVRYRVAKKRGGFGFESSRTDLETKATYFVIAGCQKKRVDNRRGLVALAAYAIV